MSLEMRIEALEREVKAIRGSGKGWRLKGEGGIEMQSNDFIPKMTPSVEKHLEALVALVGPDFKVENGQVFIKNAFIEEESTQNAKYDLTLNIARGEEERSPAEAAQNQAAQMHITNDNIAITREGTIVVRLSKI